MNVNSAAHLTTTDNVLMSDMLGYSTESEASVGFKLSFILGLLKECVYN
jgi:hypothetical protein